MQADKQPSSKGMSFVLAFVFGIVIGGIQEDFAGFVIGAMLGVLLAQVLHLRTIAKLQAQQLRPEIADPRLGAVGIGLKTRAPRGGDHAFREVQCDLVGIGGYDVALCRRDTEVLGRRVFRNLTDCGRRFQKRSFYKQSIFRAIGVGRDRKCNDTRNHT